MECCSFFTCSLPILMLKLCTCVPHIKFKSTQTTFKKCSSNDKWSKSISQMSHKQKIAGGNMEKKYLYIIHVVYNKYGIESSGNWCDYWFWWCMWCSSICFSLVFVHDTVWVVVKKTFFINERLWPQRWPTPLMATGVQLQTWNAMTILTTTDGSAIFCFAMNETFHL